MNNSCRRADRITMGETANTRVLRHQQAVGRQVAGRRKKPPAVDQSQRTTAESDAGTSLVEILVCVVLMGMVVTAILATLRTSVSASSLNRDHANAHAWLQSASDVLY